MEIWKNKKSGKGFIYIEDTVREEALFVTPEGEIKSLEKNLFEREVTEDEETITEQQKQKHQQYMADRRADAAKMMERARESMSHDEIVELLKRKQRELPAQEWSELQEKLIKALNKV